MSRIYNAEVQKKVEQFLEESGISQAKAAPMMGISQTALSQWLRGIYDNGNIEKVESKLIEFFKAHDEKKTSDAKALPFRPTQDYVPTSISEDVYKLIRYCQLEKGMVIAHGDAGIGKSEGAAKFYRDNPSSTIYIEATPSNGTLNGILVMIARALKIPNYKSKIDLEQDIGGKLYGTNKVIIIDEAQHLKYMAIEAIRHYTDRNKITGEAGVGIVLIGNTEVYDRMLGKQEARFAQQFSRILFGRYYNTSKVMKEDIQKLFPVLAEEKKQKEIDFLHSISQSKWGIRGAVNVYNNAVNNENITYDGLFSMARNMGIGLI